MPEIVVSEGVGRSGQLVAGGNASITRQYEVFNATNEADAILATNEYLELISGTSPATYGALLIDRIDVDETALDHYVTKATFKTFQRRAAPASLETQFNFEIRLEPIKVKLPVGGITVFKADGEADWEPVLINDQGDGEEPEGVDIYEPTYDESETHWIPLTSLTEAYKLTLKRSVGKVNSSTFRGNEAGEVLLIGVSGARRGATDAEVTFRWSVRENQSGISLGGVNGVTKKGWQYIWPRTRVRQGATDQPFYKFASHVAVASVFREADLNQIFNYPIPS